MFDTQFIASALTAGALCAGLVLAAPASGDTEGSVGCSPCERVSSEVAEVIESTGSGTDESTPGIGSSSHVVRKWTSFPGDTAEKWAGFPGRQAEKWAGFPGRQAEKWAGFPARTAQKWADFPRKTISKWTGLG